MSNGMCIALIVVGAVLRFALARPAQPGGPSDYENRSQPSDHARQRRKAVKRTAAVNHGHLLGCGALQETFGFTPK